MTAETIHEQLIESIGRTYVAGRFKDIVTEITDPATRRRVSSSLCEKFGMPLVDATTDGAFSAILMGCLLKENSIGDRGARDAARAFFVELLAAETLRVRGIDIPVVSGGSEPSTATSKAPAATERVTESAPEVQAVMPEIRTIRPSIVPDQPAATPDRSNVVRLVTGGEVTLRLYDGDRPSKPHPPNNLVALLVPGPGPDAQGRALGRWLAGTPANPESWAVGPARLDHFGSEQLAEIEAELLAAPRIVLERNGQHQVAEPSRRMFNGAMPSDVLEAMRDHWGAPDSEEAVNLFRHAVGRVIEEFWPEKAKSLQENGASIRIGGALAEMIATCVAAEKSWLSELGTNTGGDEQIVMGSIRPSGRMESGIMLRRAAYLTYGIGYPAVDAFAEAAMDLRYAQVSRVVKEADYAGVSANFDRAFLEDCSRSLDAYAIHEEEPVPAF